MTKQLLLSLILMLLPLTGCTTTAQDDPQAFPTDVVAAIQAEMDDLTAGSLPSGIVVWMSEKPREVKVHK